MARPPRFLLDPSALPEALPEALHSSAGVPATAFASTDGSEPAIPSPTSLAPAAGLPSAAPIQKLRLDSGESHHLRKVLRLQPGDEVEMFEPASGVSYFGRVAESGGSTVEVYVTRVDSGAAKPARIHLLVGLISSENCDLIVEKCTELGVASIHFFGAERSQYNLRGEKADSKCQRWERLTRAALKQSYGPFLPKLSISSSLEGALIASNSGLREHDFRLLLHPPASGASCGDPQPIEISHLFRTRQASFDESAAPLQNLQEMVDSYIIVGPEGGLTGSEVSLAAGRGYIACSICSNVLRTETAAVVACGVMQVFLRSLR